MTTFIKLENDDAKRTAASGKLAGRRLTTPRDEQRVPMMLRRRRRSFVLRQLFLFRAGRGMVFDALRSPAADYSLIEAARRHCAVSGPPPPPPGPCRGTAAEGLLTVGEWASEPSSERPGRRLDHTSFVRPAEGGRGGAITHEHMPPRLASIPRSPSFWPGFS